MRSNKPGEPKFTARRPVEATGADGVDRTATRDNERRLETIVGTVVVPRTAYPSPGSEDLHPMDASLNLPRELFSHGVRRMVAKEVSRASYDEVVEMVREYKGAMITKRQVEELAVRAAQDFDARATARGGPPLRPSGAAVERRLRRGRPRRDDAPRPERARRRARAAPRA